MNGVLWNFLLVMKRADEMLHSARLQSPLENTSVGSDNSIAHSVENVKTYRENLDNFTKIEYNNTSNRNNVEQTARAVERSDET